MEIGNPTTSHVHCRTLDRDDELHGQITVNQERLARLSGAPVRAFSFPCEN